MLGIGLGIAGRGGAGANDAEDLGVGTLVLDFTAVQEPTLSLNFLAGDYRAWTDDPSWPYGSVGVFRSKR